MRRRPIRRRSRSEQMALVRHKNTKPERVVRRGLWAAGLRYRLHARSLPGKPDLVFPRARLAIFIHGCFWHRHEGCRGTRTPKTNVDFWKAKFSANVRRDQRVMEELEALGWRTVVIWECEIPGRNWLELIARLLGKNN
ncbi:MAG TPA: very short patch repair endonuclease [Acetobacteraceae bacterium]|nr:very short patch repair endonuclease [Acetobacteraceae bacterium]